MARPGMFDVGQLYKGGYVNGQLYWTQPGGEGTKVYPQYPQNYPVQPETPQSFPQNKFVYWAMLEMGCGHFMNSPEVFLIWDPYVEQQAALICCSQCSYIQAIIEPATDYWEKFYMIYNTGLATGVRPQW